MGQKVIEEVLKEHTVSWMSIPGVVGTGIGEYEDVPCIKIFVDQDGEDLAEKLPCEIEGFRVTIEETGGFRALGVE